MIFTIFLTEKKVYANFIHMQKIQEQIAKKLLEKFFLIKEEEFFTVNTDLALFFLISLLWESVKILFLEVFYEQERPDAN